MNLTKKFVSVLMVFVSFATFASFNIANVSKARAFDGSLLEMIENNTDYFFTKGEVTIDDMSVEDLFDFTSDATNDVYWYPGVVASVPASPTGPCAGSTYEQTLNFGGFTLTSCLEILGEIQNKLVVQKATGAFENYALYRYKALSGNRARLTIYSAVKKAEGVTKEGLEFILNTTFPMLLSHLGKTGTFSVLVI